MLMIVGMLLVTLGFALAAAAYTYSRYPGASPNLLEWVRGETVGVFLTVLPATGMIALFYFLIDEQSRNIGYVHFVVTTGIAAVGWFATRSLARIGDRMQDDALTHAGAGPDHPRPTGSRFDTPPTRRAA